MTPRTLDTIARACEAELDASAGSIVARGLCTDSRQIKVGDMFVALSGDRFDGHAYLAEVAASGAVAGLVRRGWKGVGAPMPLLFVDDPRAALGRFASSYRMEHDPSVIAVAGSNGKTTTKEFLGNLLAQAGETVWSEASLNNDIGVPLTLLRMDAGTRFLVSEVGTNHPGELALLLRMVRPRTGILTSLGREHLEHFGSVEGVVEEEGWIAEVLPPDGLLVVNGDTPCVDRVISRTSAKVVKVGFGSSNDWRLANYTCETDGARFRVEGPWEESSGDYRILHVGRHQAVNAALALAVAAFEGMDRAAIQRGFLACSPAPMRLQVWRSGGIQILDDAYNANEESMTAALETLGEMPVKTRRLAVLGDMAELGEHSEAAHRAVGMQAARLGVNHLFAVGMMRGSLADGARSGGLSSVSEFGDVAEAASAVKAFVRAGDAVLIKASRASKLESVGKVLREFLRANEVTRTGS